MNTEKEVNDCCVTVEDKSIQRNKQLEVGLVTMQEELTSVQKQLLTLKKNVVEQSSGARATASLSSSMQESPVKQPVSSSFTPKVSGLNPQSSPFTPAGSERQFTIQSVSNQDISQTRFGRQKLPEFDEKMSLESHLAQFEDLVEMNGWSDRECAVHLSTRLKGSALEILSHRTRAEKHSYTDLVGALERCSGT